MKNKFVSLLLVFLMLTSALCFVSCAADRDDGNESSAATTDPSAAATTDETSAVGPDIPETLKYDDTEVRVLMCKEQMKQMLPTDGSEGLLPDALTRRVRKVEDRLGVKLKFIEEPGNWDNRASFISKAEAAVMNGGEYDLVVAYNLNPPTMAVRGLLMDINESDYVDFTHPWWPDRLIDTVSFNDRVFFCVDNSSYGSIRNMACIMFRKDVAEKVNLTSEAFYDCAIDGEWTIDRMEQLIQGVYSDLNNNNIRDYGDRYGFASVDKPRLDAFFYGSGLTIVGKDNEGNFVMTLGDDRVQTVLERMNRLLFDDENVYMSDDKMYQMFINEQVLFYCTPIAIVDQKLDFEFGVLPTPKLDAGQTSYITYISNTHDSFCILKNARNLDMSAAIIECLAYEAYTEVAPKYFEVMLKYKYSSDSRAGQIYDIIRRNVIFDFGYIFSENFITNPFILYRNTLTSGSTSWASKYDRFADTFKTNLQEIIDSLSAQ